MTDELRLQCLMLAADHCTPSPTHADDVLALAQRYLDFVQSKAKVVSGNAAADKLLRDYGAQLQATRGHGPTWH